MGLPVNCHCGARIAWVILTNPRRRVAVDRDPDPDGTVLVIDSPLDAELYGVRQGDAVDLSPPAAWAVASQGREVFNVHVCPRADG
jgi:hypothetical protein